MAAENDILLADPGRPEWVDTHVHLNFDNLRGDLAAVAARWRQAGVTQLVHSCCTPAEFGQLQAIADCYPEVALAVGLHPSEAGGWDAAVAAQIDAYAGSDVRVVAIGETGLDFYRESADSIEQQLRSFRSQIAIAQKHDLALIVHCREAAAATLEVLQEQRPARVVMHCWSGTPEETRWFVELGCYISFSGIITFKNAEAVRGSLQEVPLGQLLIETDCPFLAPVPHRGKRNEPAYVAEVAAMVAKVRQLPVLKLAELTTANARQLFRLPAPV